MNLPFDRFYGAYWIPITGGYNLLFFSKRLFEHIMKRSAKGKWYKTYFPIDVEYFDDRFMPGYLPVLVSPALQNVIFIKR